ncbi:MAG: hypothetical protein KDN22_02940 [Verrucomicrobiae bacterium]|nr:hypothetical protein [Verrucomicrobiae bacterium]
MNQSFVYSLLFLAQATDLNAALSKIVGLVSAISMVITFIAIVLAGIMVIMGRTEFIKHALVGAFLSGTAWILTKSIFSITGTTTGIDFQNF